MPGPNHAPRGGFIKPKDMGRTVRRLVGYLTRSKLPLLVVFLFLVLSVFSSLGGSYMMRDIINQFIWSGCTDFGGLALSVLRLVAVYLVGCLAAYGQSAVMVRLAQKGVNRLRKDLFDKLQSLPLSYFDQHPHGELTSRFTNDADNVQMALEQSVVSLCSSVLMFVGLVGMVRCSSTGSSFWSPPSFWWSPCVSSRPWAAGAASIISASRPLWAT